ncbi:GIY-YIG nuclease family protein [Aquiflexum sp.]|uniref:GIY-YIG nuclease family protein n=1 Tax=Aquiflexum sp. TaxID=1872584 RepID=UPI00359455D1
MDGFLFFQPVLLFSLMDRFFLYILFSGKLNRFYTGVTTLELEERLENHLLKKYRKLNFTQKADDWTIFHFLECDNFSLARKIELHIKRLKSIPPIIITPHICSPF